MGRRVHYKDAGPRIGTRRMETRSISGMRDAAGPLLTDLYQLNMLQTYLDRGETRTAVFEFFVRKLPQTRQFLMAAGLEQALALLSEMRFSAEDIEWLKSTGRFRNNLLEYLESLRFTGTVHAMAEGTVFFANEPILRVTAPLPEAQLFETRLINVLHYQTLIASKAARLVLLAPGKQLVDFGLRRAHGGDAGLMAARASYIAGFAGTATLLAEKDFGIPTFGTMAHSFIEAHDSESEAFRAFANSRPEHLTLLIDTYDCERAARKIVGLAPALKEKGIAIGAVRIDSGDLGAIARRVRAILDEGGLQHVIIFASGGLDEPQIARLLDDRAPIDGFGIGTALTVSADAPSLDCAYKLEEYAGRARRKRSAGKATWPGAKQVWRHFAGDAPAGDTIALASEHQDGEPLLTEVMRNGNRYRTVPTLEEIRSHAMRELEALPQPFRALDPDARYPVRISEALERLAVETDAMLDRLE